MDLLVARADGVATVTLARTERRNALSLGFMREIRDAIATLARDRTVRVIVIRADGPVFSAGHDIAEMIDKDEEYYQTLFAACTELMSELRQAPQPVIARVDGVATAAGCQLVAGADLAVASESSTFATPGVRIGLFCSTPMVPIARAIGPKRALEMLFTGRPITAATALEWGLVNRVVPSEQLDETVRALAVQIAEFSAETLAIGKRAFYSQQHLSESEAYISMSSVMVDNVQRSSAREGLAAFVEKRAPSWPS